MALLFSFSTQFPPKLAINSITQKKQTIVTSFQGVSTYSFTFLLRAQRQTATEGPAALVVLYGCHQFHGGDTQGYQAGNPCVGSLKLFILFFGLNC